MTHAEPSPDTDTDTAKGANAQDDRNGASIPEMAPASRRRRGLLIVGVLCALVLAVGGASAAYLLVFKPSPENVLAEALLGLSDAKAFEYAARLRIEGTVSATSPAATTVRSFLMPEPGSDAPAKMLLTMNGAVDRLDPSRLKSRFSVRLASTKVSDGSPILGLEVRQIEDKTYVSLTDAPSNFLFDLSPLTGTWVRIDRKALVSQFISATGTAPQPKKEISDEQKTRIKKAFAELKPIRVAETLKDEEVDGQPSRHYRLAVDKEALKTFVSRLQTIMEDDASLAYEKFNDDLQRYAKEITITTFEVWIARDGGLPDRILLTGTGTPTETVPADGTATFDVKFKNFGQPVQLETPADAKELSDIFATLMGTIDAKTKAGSSEMLEK